MLGDAYLIDHQGYHYLKMTDFREIKEWEKAHELTVDVYEVTKSFPEEELSYAELSYAELSYAELSYAELSYAELSDD